MATLDRSLGRTAFGADPASYDRARPAYPERIYEILRGECELGRGTPTFEAGPGSGIATRRLIELGADPMVAIEPDPRLAAYLRETIASPTLQVVESAFEDAELAAGRFRLGCAATVFHWLDAERALARAARAIAPGGWWAMWWNMFGDPEVEFDAFHEATFELLNGPRSPSAGVSGGPWFAQHREARAAELAAAGFEAPHYEEVRWTLVLDPPRVRALYATYSELQARPQDERERILDRLHAIAAGEFGGRVERHVVTPVYWARRS
jgi:SAM-dependent methyltransferase